MNLDNLIRGELENHLHTIKDVIDKMQPSIKQCCKVVTETIASSNKILLCGNGGSAGDAQHIAAEITGRYKTSRRGLPAIALTTDTSALTAISNDFGFDEVFRRQVEAIAVPGDLLIAISTSGSSANVINAISEAKSLNCRTIGFIGKGGGDMLDLCDLNLVVPSDNTPRIQEIHILLGHIIAHSVDDYWSTLK